MKHLEFVTGAIMSVISMDIWGNLLLSVLIAFLGGFAAAAAKKLHERVYNYSRRKKHHSVEETNEK
jgi:hypothetical protein